MKKIGIIGGVGPQATAFLYNKIIELSQSKYKAVNNNDYPRIIIESVPIPDFISNKDKIDEATQMLLKSSKNLEMGKATILCIGSNTVHILLEKLKNESKIEFVSMIDLVAHKVNSLGFKKVGLLGTPVLIESKIYNEVLDKYNIELILPDYSEIKFTEIIIRDVLAGKVTSNKKEKYAQILTNLFNRGAETIILGCTELPLAINYEALGNRTINSEAVLAEGIVDYYYQ